MAQIILMAIAAGLIFAITWSLVAGILMAGAIMAFGSMLLNGRS